MDTDTSTKHPEDAAPQEYPVQWGWLLALGLLMLVLGTFGFYLSTFVTLTTVLVFGAFYLTAGILQIVQGIKAKETRWSGRMLHFAVAIVYILVGVLIFVDPIAASLGITLALAALFMFIGGMRIAHALQSRKKQWKWVLPITAGIIDLLLGAIIIANWPASGLWVIGLLVSIELIMNGWYLVVVALGVRANNGKSLKKSSEENNKEEKQHGDGSQTV